MATSGKFALDVLDRPPLAGAETKYLATLIDELLELRNQPETDEFGILRPSEPAFEQSCRLLIDAATLLAGEGEQIPRGCASTDSEGGVRIEWVRPNASVHLVVPATSQREVYVYHEVAGKFGTEAATPDSLARRLRAID